MATFAESTEAFFDELSKIVDGFQADKEEGQDRTNDRPYSSLLTQDEEPSDYHPAESGEEEPMVVTRNGV